MIRDLIAYALIALIVLVPMALVIRAAQAKRRRRRPPHVEIRIADD